MLSELLIFECSSNPRFLKIPGFDSWKKKGFWVIENSQKNRFWVQENLGWKHYTTVQGCWMLCRSPGSHPQMFRCIPSWHIGSWSRQHTDWGVGMSGWPLVWIASVEVCRHWWSCIQRHLRTTTQSLIVLENDRPVTIPTTHGQMWPAHGSCSGLTQLVKSWESRACLQWVSCRTMMKVLFLSASCSMTKILFAVSLLVFSWSMLGCASLPCPEKGILWPIPCRTHPARVAVVALVVTGLVDNCSECRKIFAEA